MRLSIVLLHPPARSFFFFFNDTATTEIYTLSLHDALPISPGPASCGRASPQASRPRPRRSPPARSEEHTSELQSQSNLVCRLLLEKKKINQAISCTILRHNNILLTVHV